MDIQTVINLVLVALVAFGVAAMVFRKVDGSPKPPKPKPQKVYPAVKLLNDIIALNDVAEESSYAKVSEHLEKAAEAALADTLKDDEPAPQPKPKVQ